MGKSKKLYYLKMVMLVINFIMVCFLIGLIYITTIRIHDSYNTREFLEALRFLPSNPASNTAKGLGGIILLCFIMVLRNSFFEEKQIVIAASFAIELIVCFFIMASLNMSYNGIVLLVIVDIVTHINGNRNKVIFMAATTVLYVLADYDVLSIYFKMPSIGNYIYYYDAATAGYILGFKNILTSLNMIIFILYIILLMQEKIDENVKFRILNHRLNVANEELKVMNVQLQEYAVKTEKLAETRERNRLAREIHDTLGHSLTGISAGLDACIELIEVSPEATKKQLHIIGEVARQGIKDVRRSVEKLRPDALEHLSLKEALDKMIQDINTMTSTKIFFNCTVTHLKFNGDEEEAIYRVVQEGITNAVRHGHASRIMVSILKKDNILTLIIQDNGSGCQEMSSGFGLKHIKERIQMLNGTVRYDGTNGFTITVTIPIRWGEEYD